MLRRILISSFAILGLAACGQSGKSEQGTAAVGAAAGASPYAATCLEMASSSNWSEASRLCALALNADPSDEKVKAALESANAALAAEPAASDAVSIRSGEAADEAADDAAEEAADKAKEALPN